jgi:HK97 family phage major capsid protein
MALTNTSGAPLLAPEEVDRLLVQPTFAQSICTQIARVVRTGAFSFRLPYVSADPTAAWIAEGNEITPSDQTISEIDVVPAKLAGLSIISRELATDSSPAAAEEIGQGLARDLARTLDLAFFGTVGGVAPAGLGGLVGVTPGTSAAAFTSVDPFETAVNAVEAVGGNVSAWVGNAASVLELALIKKLASGSNESLLAPDPTQPARRMLVGRPVYVSPGVATKTIFGITGDRAVIVVRDDARLEVDGSVFFTSDRVAIKATLRVGFGFPHPAAIAKITHT